MVDYEKVDKLVEELNKGLNEHRVSAQSSTYGSSGKMKDDTLVFAPNTFLAQFEKCSGCDLAYVN